MTRTLRIGTRGSALALVQAHWVAARLAEHGVATEITIIRTEGDDRPVDTAWGEGAFVGRIVAALLDGSVDLAVHSAKDVPTDEHPLLAIAAYPPREDPRDALVCRVRGTTLATLPEGRPGGHRQPAPGRVPAGAAPGPRAPPAPRQRRHPAREAGPRRLRRARPRGCGADPPRPRGPHRRHPAAGPRGLGAGPGLAGAAGAGRRRRGDRGRRAASTTCRPASRSRRSVRCSTGPAAAAGRRSGSSGRVAGDRLELVGRGRSARGLPARARRIWPPRAGGLGPRHAPRSTSAGTSPRGWPRASSRCATRPRALVAPSRGPGRTAPRRARRRGRGCRPRSGHRDPARHPPAATWTRPSRRGARRHRSCVASANAAAAALEAIDRLRHRSRRAPLGRRGARDRGRPAGRGIAGVFVPSAADAATLAAELPLGAGRPRPRAARRHRRPGASPRPCASAARTSARSSRTRRSRPRRPPARCSQRRSTTGPSTSSCSTSGSTVRGLLALADDADPRRDPRHARRRRRADRPLPRHATPGSAPVLVAPAPDAASLAAFTARALGAPPARSATGEPSPIRPRPATTGGAR